MKTENGPEDLTFKFINLRVKYSPHFTARRNSAQIWYGTILKELNLVGKLEWHQLKAKWSQLTQKYKQLADKRPKSGVGTEDNLDDDDDWPFFDMMHDFYRGNPVMKPVAVLSSADPPPASSSKGPVPPKKSCSDETKCCCDETVQIMTTDDEWSDDEGAKIKTYKRKKCHQDCEKTSPGHVKTTQSTLPTKVAKTEGKTDQDVMMTASSSKANTPASETKKSGVLLPRKLSSSSGNTTPTSEKKNKDCFQDKLLKEFQESNSILKTVAEAHQSSAVAITSLLERLVSAVEKRGSGKENRES